MTEVGRQEPKWRDYYEEAWATRWRVMEDLIAAGARHPLQVVRLFEKHERKFSLVQQGGQLVWRRESMAGQRLPSGTPWLKQTSFRGQALPVPFHAHFDQVAFIADVIDEQGPFDLVVELGCGYGRNLFGLAYGAVLGPRLVGGELTESGVVAGRTLAALDPALDITFGHFDYLKPDLGWIGRGRRVLVFTYHSVEQVTYIDTGVFSAICALGDEVVGVHIEPFGFQVEPTLGPITESQGRKFLDLGWNLNFARTLWQASEQGILGIDMLLPEPFLPVDSGNPGSLAVWHSKAPRT